MTALDAIGGWIGLYGQALGLVAIFEVGRLWLRVARLTFARPQRPTRAA